MKTTILHYRKYLFMYGILSLLFVLRKFEEDENYEECQKIIDSIREQEKRLDITLFTINIKRKPTQFTRGMNFDKDI